MIIKKNTPSEIFSKFVQKTLILSAIVTISACQASKASKNEAKSNSSAAAENDFEYSVTINDYSKEAKKSDEQLFANNKNKTVIQNKFDENECSHVEVRTIDNQALFDFDSANLTPKAKAILNEQVKWLNLHPSVNIVVEGHCDSRGSQKYNLALGKKRALAAKAQLVAGGVAAKRISVVSYGEDRPVATGTSKEDYDRNRRIVIKAEKK